ncbi:heavy-metal-associated domain-containing protein [Arthrobacter sp. NPDC056493]|uniref:heavy-metal-associated domain-containing protein n=1 Tax=Arthrobacter sp. NPDC056493 TaxID=3345839 RepID=UPI00366CEA90
MCGTESRKELPLVSAASGCSCCSTEAASEAPVAGDSEYALEGLTCGHCVQTVEKAVTAVAGVDAASVGLVPRGRSRLVVSGAVSEAELRDAVASGRYSLITT